MAELQAKLKKLKEQVGGGSEGGDEECKEEADDLLSALPSAPLSDKTARLIGKGILWTSDGISWPPPFWFFYIYCKDNTARGKTKKGLVKKVQYFIEQLCIQVCSRAGLEVILLLFGRWQRIHYYIREL